MNLMREKQRKEAVSRLKLMDIHQDIRRKFEEEGSVMLCDDGDYSPVNEELEEEISHFEEKHSATVFLAVRMRTTHGVLDSLLFVGKYEEEWPMEQADIKDGYIMSYTINRRYPDCSEMGSIVFRISPDGIMVREG